MLMSRFYKIRYLGIYLKLAGVFKCSCDIAKHFFHSIQCNFKESWAPCLRRYNNWVTEE